MNKCKWTGKNLTAFLSGELDEYDRVTIEEHLRICPECRAELQEINMIFQEAGQKKQAIEEEMESIDWDALPQKIAAHVFDKEKKIHNLVPRKTFQSLFLQPGFRPVMAGLLIGIVLGSFVTFMMVRSAGNKSGQRMDFSMSQAAFDRMELEVARREAVDYLDQSQLLLLDLVQSSSPVSVAEWKQGVSTQRAKDLLSKKKYINPQLDRFRMAKAKAICDQIELLFYELALMSEDMTDEEFNRIRELVEKKQLLLKIKIVKKELEQSEV